MERHYGSSRKFRHHTTLHIRYRDLFIAVFKEADGLRKNTNSSPMFDVLLWTDVEEIRGIWWVEQEKVQLGEWFSLGDDVKVPKAKHFEQEPTERREGTESERDTLSFGV